MLKMLENFRQRNHAKTAKLSAVKMSSTFGERAVSLTHCCYCGSPKSNFFYRFLTRRSSSTQLQNATQKQLLNRKIILPTKEQTGNQLCFSVMFSLLMNWFFGFCRRTANRCNHSERRNSTADQCRMLSAYIATWTKRIAEPWAWSRHCMCVQYTNTHAI